MTLAFLGVKRIGEAHHVMSHVSDVITDKTQVLSATLFPGNTHDKQSEGVRDMFTSKIYGVWFMRNILVAHWMFSYMKPFLRVMVTEHF